MANAGRRWTRQRIHDGRDRGAPRRPHGQGCGARAAARHPPAAGARVPGARARLRPPRPTLPRGARHRRRVVRGSESSGS